MPLIELLLAKVMNKANARRVRGEGAINNSEVSAFAGRGEMAVFLITGAITGILLGLRFKVLVLVPASVLATVVVIVSRSGHELGVIVLTLVGTLVALQMGYLAGSILRFLARAYLPGWARHRRSGTKS
jgi:hypothetical protein